MKKFTSLLIRLTILCCVTVMFGNAAFGTSFTVDTIEDTQDALAGDGVCSDLNGRCSLRAAISEANALAGDDIITLPAGAYTTTLAGAHENANANGDFDITSNITINGAASSNTFIQAAPNAGTATERPLQISAVSSGSAVVVVNNVTLRHGRYTTDLSGAGFQVEGTGANVTLNNVVFRDNRGFRRGAGIHVAADSPMLTLNNCFVTNNHINLNTGSAVATAGGIQIDSGSVSIINTTISGNTVNSSVSDTIGAGINLIGGTLDLTNSTVSNNRAITNASFFLGLRAAFPVRMQS